MKRTSKDELKNKITDLERIVSILSKENCVFILANMLLNGIMNYEDLKRETKLGKATIFRNLELLLKSKFIKKARDESIEDKRKSTIYYRSEEEIKIPLIDKELIDLLEREKKTDLLKNVNKYQNSLSDALVRVMTIRRNKQEPGTKGKNLTMMVLFEGSVAPAVEKKVFLFLEEIKKDIKNVKTDYTKAMNEPVLLRINFIQDL